MDSVPLSLIAMINYMLNFQSNVIEKKTELAMDFFLTFPFMRTKQLNFNFNGPNFGSFLHTLYLSIMIIITISWEPKAIVYPNVFFFPSKNPLIVIIFYNRFLFFYSGVDAKAKGVFKTISLYIYFQHIFSHCNEFDVRNERY